MRKAKQKKTLPNPPTLKENPATKTSPNSKFGNNLKKILSEDYELLKKLAE